MLIMLNQLEFSMEKRYSERTVDFYRKKNLPEEERATLIKWDGSFRWFRSPNVLCIEHYRPIPNKNKLSKCAAH
jgi:hypothetical protein